MAFCWLSAMLQNIWHISSLFYWFSHSYWEKVNTYSTSECMCSSEWVGGITVVAELDKVTAEGKKAFLSLNLWWSWNTESCAHSLRTRDVTVREYSWENCQPSYLLTMVLYPDYLWILDCWLDKITLWKHNFRTLMTIDQTVNNFRWINIKRNC